MISRSTGHALAIGITFAWAWWTGRSLPLVATATFVFLSWIWTERSRWSPTGRFGTANAITFVRLLIALALALLPTEHIVPWAGWATLAFFTLDGIDGWFARREGTASEFGAAFDMETDALMVAVTTLCAVRVELLGPWVLLVGGLRYAFVVASSLRTTPPEPRRRGARWAFSTLMVGLCAALAFPGPLTITVLALGAAAVIVSFGRSFVWMWSRH